MIQIAANTFLSNKYDLFTRRFNFDQSGSPLLYEYKDKEALFNVAYNVTDNISSRAILRHNNIFNRY